MRMCDLRQKEVINICDGARLGYVCDIEFCLPNGKITHIIVGGPGKVFGLFGRENEYVIDICQIKQIGEDVILVEVILEKCIRKCKF